MLGCFFLPSCATLSQRSPNLQHAKDDLPLTPRMVPPPFELSVFKHRLQLKQCHSILNKQTNLSIGRNDQPKRYRTDSVNRKQWLALAGSNGAARARQKTNVGQHLAPIQRIFDLMVGYFSRHAGHDMGVDNNQIGPNKGRRNPQIWVHFSKRATTRSREIARS